MGLILLLCATAAQAKAERPSWEFYATPEQLDADHSALFGQLPRARLDQVDLLAGQLFEINAQLLEQGAVTGSCANLGEVAQTMAAYAGASSLNPPDNHRVARQQLLLIVRPLQIATWRKWYCPNARDGPDVELAIQTARSGIRALAKPSGETTPLGALDEVAEDVFPTFFPTVARDRKSEEFALPGRQMRAAGAGFGRMDDVNIATMVNDELISSARSLAGEPAYAGSEAVRFMLVNALSRRLIYRAARGESKGVEETWQEIAALAPNEQKPVSGDLFEFGPVVCNAATFRELARWEAASAPLAPSPRCRGLDQSYNQLAVGSYFYLRALTRDRTELVGTPLPYLMRPLEIALRTGTAKLDDPFANGIPLETRLKPYLEHRTERDVESQFAALQLATDFGLERSIALGIMQKQARASQVLPQFKAWRDGRYRLENNAGAMPALMAQPSRSEYREVSGADSILLPADERRAVQQEVDALERSLNRSIPGFAAQQQGDVQETGAVRAVLGSDEVLIIVGSSPFGTQSVAISVEGSNLASSSWDRGRMRRSVERLLWDVGADIVDADSPVDKRWMASSDGGRTFSRQLAYEIYREVIAPHSALLAGKHKLIVVASGPLAALPSTVLVGEPPQGSDSDSAVLRQTAWLAERFAISHLPTVGSLIRRRSQPQPETQTYERIAFTGIGDPVTLGEDLPCGETRGGGRKLARMVRNVEEQRWTNPADMIRALPRIRCTGTEIAQVAEAVGAASATTLLAEDATEARVRALDLSNADLILFATHGLVGDFSKTRVTESALVLTPPDESAPDYRNDGFLLASDIAALTLKAEMVVLSACNTGAGKDTDSPPLEGLAAAFLQAGAGNVVVSHWPVGDRVAPMLTREAVRLLRESSGRISKPEAFQRAMRKVRNNTEFDTGPEVSMAHPTAWASFSIVGD